MVTNPDLKLLVYLIQEGALPPSPNTNYLCLGGGVARSRTTSVSSTGGGGALPPPSFVHTPDHGGPGFQPAVSSGAGS